MIMEDGNTPYLPEEIIRDILKRLPVKSLIRIQCVCKHWKNLLKTSSFISDHLRHSHQNSFLLFECYGEYDPYEEYDPLHLCLVDRELGIHKVENAPQVPSVVASIVNSNNGLLCVRHHGTTHSFLVYNPAIREVRLVPKPLIYHAREKCYSGFGFSPIVNDYRIVRMRLCGSFYYDMVYGAEVFSLSTGSWKKVEVGNLKGVTIRKDSSFTLDGVIFWFGSKGRVAKEGENHRYLIVSFDIAMEVFTLIPMPPLQFNYDAVFAVYENNLAVLSPIGNPESCLIELWVMEEDASLAEENERWSWTKKYTSNPYPCLLFPKTIWGNEIVCLVHGRIPRHIRETEGEVENYEVKPVMINLTTDEVNRFAHSRFISYHVIFNHVESLVPVNNVPNEESRT